MHFLKKFTAKDIVIVMEDSAGSFKTGLTLTITASKNGGSFSSISPTVTELSNGSYKIALTTSHTDTAGELWLYITATGAEPQYVACIVEAPVDVQTINSNATAAATLAAFWSAQITNTAQAGASTTITLSSGSNATNDYYNDMAVVILSGTGAGQVRKISDYNGSTKVATVEVAWATNPDNTSVYMILGRIE